MVLKNLSKAATEQARENEKDLHRQTMLEEEEVRLFFNV